MKHILSFLLLISLTFAQTAKVSQLTEGEAARARQLHAAVKNAKQAVIDAQKDVDAFDSSIRIKYKFDAIEYSEDFQYIVPSSNAFIWTQSASDCMFAEHLWYCMNGNGVYVPYSQYTLSSQYCYYYCCSSTGCTATIIK